jgi:2-oxoglutarate ferredoxin oxidoreductase subunit alpha
MAQEAFDLAFRYRNPVMILGDAMVGQIKEPVVCAAPAPPVEPGHLVPEDNAASWCLSGKAGRETRLLKSVWLNDNDLQVRVRRLLDKYERMRGEARAEQLQCADADLVLVAFGSVGRIARALVLQMRREGNKLGLFRPQTLYPFPDEPLRVLADQGKRFLVLEQNGGQMVEDVRLALPAASAAGKVDWFGIMPGSFPCAEDMADVITQAIG